MAKLLVKLDLLKIDKSKIVDGSYVNAGGDTIKTKDYEFEIMKLNEKKLIWDGGDKKLFKTHFAADTQTKEEREASKPTNFLGGGVMFEYNTPPPATPATPTNTPTAQEAKEFFNKDTAGSTDPNNGINADDIPF